MTYEQMIPELALSYFLNIFSIAIEFLMAFNILMICKCFFGRDIKIRKATVVLPCVYLAIRVVLNITVFVINLIIAHNDPSAMFDVNYDAPEIVIMKLINIGINITITVIMVGLAYPRHRLLHGVEAYVMIIFIELYMQMLVSLSLAFFDDDIETYMFRDTGGLAAENTAYHMTYFSLVVVLFFILYFGMYRKGNSMYIKRRYRILFVVWEFILILSLAVPLEEDTTKMEMYTIMGRLLGVMYPLLGVVFPLLIVILISRKNIMEKNLLQENYIAAELEYISQYKKSQEETRAFRHDVINNLSLLSSMIKNEKNKEADAYLEEMLGEVRAMSPKYITGDEMLDCLVGMKVSRMELSGIKFTLDGVADGGLGMKPTDICSIFANALDNAIEACERADEDERLIKLQIRKSGQFFNIKLSNTYTEKDGKLDLGKLFNAKERITSKEDKNLHGYGTQNIRSAVEKNDGMIKAEAEGGMYTLSLMLPRPISA